MRLTGKILGALADEASVAARAAGQLIAAARPDHIESKRGGGSTASQIVTDVDKRAEQCILEGLAPSAAQFDFAILSEEQPDDKQRLTKTHFWAIDPLDGTLPYVEDSPGYAVSIALVSRRGAPLIGVVFDPLRDVLYRAIARRGYSREPADKSPRARGEVLSVFADRSLEAAPRSAQVIEALRAIALELGLTGIDLRVGAGAVMNACYALETAPACYIKLPKPNRGGGSLWDFAATACLFREAGAIASDILGEPLDLNRSETTFMNHRGVLFATDAVLAEKLRARCA